MAAQRVSELRLVHPGDKAQPLSSSEVLRRIIDLSLATTAELFELAMQHAGFERRRATRVAR